MPKKSKELSALSVAKIKETGRHSVGGVDGLCLNVEGNSRVWILRAVVGKRLDKDGKLKPHRRDIGIGPYPEVSLAEARAKATELRLQIRNGIDPIAHKQKQLEKLHVQKLREKTFKECAKVVIANKTRELK
ncbi:MAG: Arm DNA-binding domain-containing protein, partial [Pseudomonadota bacterium]|nr:Arm DNA-binding domain-containing protein [Pseudomonadota bacterium]